MAIFNRQGESSDATAARAAWLSRVPVKLAQILIVMSAVLLAWHEWADPTQGMDASILRETFRIRLPKPPVEYKPGPRRMPATISIGGRLTADSKILVDPGHELDPLFAALWELEQAPKSSTVTILHYGDSPTTADLITGEIRASLQDRFGDAGRGYTLIAKPWPWYGHRGVEVSGHGWRIKTGVGLMREGVYGLGGASFEGDAGANSTFKLTEDQQASLTVEFLARPDGGSFAVSADGDELQSIPTADGQTMLKAVSVNLPPGTKSVGLRVTAGTVELFGVDFRRGPGVLYSSLGLNGATTSVLARTMPPAIWGEALANARPQLIIINYGSNESSFGSFVHKMYADELRLAIRRIRTLSPGTPILIMSPMDRGVRSGLDEIQTLPTIPEIIAIQRKVAAETHCAFFDTYDAMGGEGTIARWYAASPRLVTADLLHPTPQGAATVAGLFVDELSLGYDRWKVRQGIQFSAAAIAAQKICRLSTAHVRHGRVARQHAPAAAKGHSTRDLNLSRGKAE